jgi:hypothetical protein
MRTIPARWKTALLALVLALPTAGRAASLVTTNTTYTVATGSQVEVPVTADLTAGEAVLSLELRLTLPTNWTVLGLAPGAGFLDDQGAVVDVYMQDNVLELAAAGQQVISGNGVLFVVQALVSGSGWADLSQVVLNEGSPAVTVTDGYMTHQPPAALTLSPNQVQNLLVEDTVQFICAAALPPLTWSVSNPGVGSVGDTGLFTADSQGQTRVLLDASNGSHGESQLINVYSHALTVGNVTGMAGTELLLDLNLANPAALEFGSLVCRVDLNSSRLSLLAVETAGTLCEGWTGLQAVQNGEVVTVAGADAAAIGGAGVLLRLRLASTPGTGLNTTLTLDQADLDENHEVRRTNGTLNLTATGSFTLGPNTVTLKRGTTRTVTVSGAPNGNLSWSSSNPAVGTVDASAVFHALAGGTTVLSAVDELGQTDATEAWQVYDLDAWLETAVEVEQGGSVLLPVWCDSLVGLTVESFECNLAWSSPLLSITGMETAGSLCAGLETAFFGDSLSAGFSAAGNLPDTEGLPLVWLVCELDPEAVPNQTLPLTLTALFNEGYPVVQTSSGSVRVLASTAVEPLPVPHDLELEHTWPNPFNPETRIAFSRGPILLK